MIEIKGVAFDLDGTLIKDYSSWNLIRDYYGLTRKHLIQYLNGEIDGKTWIGLEKEDWSKKKIKEEEIRKILLSKNNYTLNAEETINELKRKGLKIAIVSGAPSILVEHIAKELGIKDCFGDEILFDDLGNFCGFGKLDGTFNKDIYVKEFANRYKIPLDNICVVGDNFNDRSMFQIAGWSIAFNCGDKELETYADATLTGDLSQILEYVR